MYIYIFNPFEKFRHGTNTDRSVECQGVRLICAVSYS